MYYVIYNDDELRLFIKNKAFNTYEQARKYADSIAKSRMAIVLKAATE